MREYKGLEGSVGKEGLRLDCGGPGPLLPSVRTQQARGRHGQQQRGNGLGACPEVTLGLSSPFTHSSVSSKCGFPIKEVSF